MNNLLFFPQIQNLQTERFWVEANTRVNYPIKAALVDFDNRIIFDIDNMVHRYCVSCLPGILWITDVYCCLEGTLNFW